MKWCNKVFLCERLHVLYSGTPVSIAVNIVLAIIVVIVASSTVFTEVFYYWFGVVVVVMAFRGWSWYLFFKQKCDDINGCRFYLWQVVGILATALVWSTSIWLVFQGHNGVEEFFIIFIVTGLMAGASSLLFVDRAISMLFYTPMLVGTSLLLWLQGDLISREMAIMGGIYLSFLIFNTKRLYVIFLNDLQSRAALERMNTDLKESQTTLQLIFDHIDMGIIFYDCRYRIINANRTFSQSLDVPKERLVGLDMLKLKDQRIFEALRAPCEEAKEGYYRGEYRTTLSAKSIWVEIKTLPLLKREGEIIGAIGLVRDFSTQRIAKEESEIFAKFYTQNPHPVLRIDRRDAHIILANDAMKILLKQWSKNDLERWQEQLKKVIAKGRTWRFLFEVGKKAYHFEVVPVQEHYFNLYGRDVTIEERAKRRAHELAYYDDLTGLPRRNLFFEMIKKAIALSRRSGAYNAILFFDLDDFKRINDSLGHDIGDKLLIQVAKRIETEVRQSDTFCRLGGDEFALLLVELSADLSRAINEAHRVGKKVLDLFCQPFWIEGHQIHIGVSIGITLFKDEKGPYDLLKEADTAMYQAKRGGKNALFFFDHHLAEEMSQKAYLVERLHDAITNDRLQLFYQPQIDLASGKIVGAEALLRWNDEELGFVSPAVFIPAAEESGMIHQLGIWVLKQACKDLKDALKALDYVAVNVSALEFARSDFVETTIRTVEEMGVDFTRLELELTESLLVKEIKEATKKVKWLRERGFSFAIDDFGTGYSSLSYLKNLPVEALKVDQTFVRDIGEDLSDEKLVESIVGIAKNFGMLTIAEGVEDEKQLRFIRQIGCDRVQGYYFGKPMNVEHFVAWQKGREEDT